MVGRSFDRCMVQRDTFVPDITNVSVDLTDGIAVRYERPANHLRPLLPSYAFHALGPIIKPKLGAERTQRRRVEAFQGLSCGYLGTQWLTPKAPPGVSLSAERTPAKFCWVTSEAFPRIPHFRPVATQAAIGRICMRGTKHNEGVLRISEDFPLDPPWHPGSKAQS
jgi:hypothetical protein